MLLIESSSAGMAGHENNFEGPTSGFLAQDPRGKDAEVFTSGPEKDLTDILDVVGDTGRWQRRIFFTMVVAIIPAAMHNMSITFLAPELDHWCAKPAELQNVTLEQWRSYGSPAENGRCYRYENLSAVSFINENVTDTSSLRTVACNRWDYDESLYISNTSTVLRQWDLVCEKEWLVSLSKSMFMAGILVGVTLFGYISDKIGRRPTIAVACSMTILSAFVCGFSVSFPMFIVARFFLASGIGGYYIAFFVLLMEVCGPKLRSVYGLAVQFGWCTGFVVLPGIAYFIRDWFWLQMALTFPFIGLLGIWWLIPESPRWLLSVGKIDEAKNVLMTAAKVNKTNVSKFDAKIRKVMLEANKAYELGENEGTVLDLLITPGLRMMTINIFFLWFVNAFVYYGLSYNTNELAGDPFINFALSGAVEFPAYFLSIFAVQNYGRRRPLAAIMITAGMACILAYPLPEEPGWPTVVVTLIGKFCISSSFGIVFVFTTELFPTVVRNAGLGWASFSESVGSIIAPFTRELGLATHPVVPLVVIGALSFVSGSLVLLLPETHNCVVPNTLKEASEFCRRKSSKSVKTSAKLEVGYVGIAMTDSHPFTTIS